MVARRKQLSRRFAAGEYDERWHGILRRRFDFFAELPPQFRHGLNDLSRRPSDDVLHEAWGTLRDAVMQEHSAERRAVPSRPWAWWAFDHPGERDEAMPEHEQLALMGELSEQERAMVARLHTSKKEIGNEHD
jgi:hypothetical protein